jgi:hypothetical protein
MYEHPASDDLLAQDPIATAKVAHPYDPPDLEAAGLMLPDLDDDANEAAAAVVLAQLAGDEDAITGPGVVDDDAAVDDPHDRDSIEEI